MIKGVVFDMDGVLFDTESLSEKLLKDIFLQQGEVLSDDCFRSILGVTTVTSRRIITEAYPRFDYDKMLACWNESMQRHVLEKGIPLKKGVPEVLHRLRKKGIKVGLATSTQRKMVELYFEKAGFEGLFDAMVCGAEAEKGKPAPDVYLKCAELMGLAPETCAGVEDSFNGVKAVRAAGMFSIMVPDIIPYGDGHKPFVDEVLNDLTEL